MFKINSPLNDLNAGDDLLENGNEDEEALANEDAEQDSYEHELTNDALEEEEEHEVDQQPISDQDEAQTPEPRFEATNEEAEREDALHDADADQEEVDVANNNQILDGHDDSEATEEGQHLAAILYKKKKKKNVDVFLSNGICCGAFCTPNSTKCDMEVLGIAVFEKVDLPMQLGSIFWGLFFMTKLLTI